MKMLPHENLNIIFICIKMDAKSQDQIEDEAAVEQ